MEHLTAFFQEFALASTLALGLQVVLTVGVILRVVLTRHPPGSSFAWILLTLALPYIGFLLYVMIGEKPIGRWRAFKMKKAARHWNQVLSERPCNAHLLQRHAEHAGLLRLAQHLGHIPSSDGSKLELISQTDRVFMLMINDIAQARHNIDMEFYIWNVGGLVDTLSETLIQAAERGVRCRILVDAIGSREFLSSDWPHRFKEAGIHLSVALPVRFLSFGKGRADLRLHRKTVVIDDRIGYTGSLNMIDPAYFKKEANLGQWVDAMARVEGSAVSDLKLVIDYDWALQPDDESRMPEILDISPTPAVGSACVTVVPSGPSSMADANLRLIIEAVNNAKRRVLITTPYFVPGEALVMALQNAAIRGVDVHLCVPEANDSVFVRWASRRYFEGLMACGVHIMLFQDGLLHTKAITIDDELAIFGTVNMDNRSMHLNFEMMLLVFDNDFVSSLVALQEHYESRSLCVNPTTWHGRSFGSRLREGLCYLLSPLL